MKYVLFSVLHVRSVVVWMPPLFYYYYFTFFLVCLALSFCHSFSNSRCMIELWACVRMVDVRSAGWLVLRFHFLLLFHSLVHVNGGAVRHYMCH